MRGLLEERGVEALVQRAETLARFIDHEIEKDMAEVRQPLLREAVTYLFTGGGKRLRPFLVLTCAEAMGAETEMATAPALAVEYLHNLSLIHDDMMDLSDTRHGRPALHKKFGEKTALLVGDLLYAKAVEQTSRVPRHAIRMVDTLAKAAKAMCFGQFEDMSFETRLDLEVDDYLSMAVKKTSALYRASCICGMLAGDATEAQLQAMADFGEMIGTAFQIWDDVLDLQADPLRLGKPLGLDIRDGKKTLIVIHFLKCAAPAEREQFLKLLGNKEITGEPHEAVQLLEATGSISYARNIALKFLEEAKTRLHVLPDSPSRDLLYQYSDFLIQRSY
ncbi:MAG: polyprenyl synthetase family protein [Blastocatellia bacterium]|nr:polyprenyl synthetase family protein [Blastocatellia bacterium]